MYKLFPLFALTGGVVDPKKPTEVCKKFDMDKCYKQSLIIDTFAELCDMLPTKGCKSSGLGAWMSWKKQCKEKWIPAIKGIKKIGGNVFAAGRRRGETNELNKIGTVNDFVSWFPEGRKAERKGFWGFKKGKGATHCFRHVSTAKTGKPKGQPMCGICKPRWSTCNVGGFKGLYGQYPKGRKSCTFADAWRDGARCNGVAAGKTSTECRSGYCFSNGHGGGICARSNGKLDNGWGCRWAHDCKSARCPGGGVFGGRRKSRVCY